MKYKSSMLIGLLCSLLIMMSVAFAGTIFQRLSLLEISQYQNSPFYAGIVIVAYIVLFTAGLFLINHQLMRTIFQQDTSPSSRSLFYLANAALVYPINYRLAHFLPFEPIYLVISSLVFVVLLDFLTEYEQQSGSNV